MPKLLSENALEEILLDQLNNGEELATGILESIYGSEEIPDSRFAESFKDAGVLTNNRGLVWRLPNGQEIQIKIHVSGAK